MLLLLATAALVGAATVGLAILVRPAPRVLVALAVGIPLQPVVMATVLIPMVGQQAVYLSLWKECVVVVAVLGLAVYPPRRSSPLPWALNLTIAATVVQLAVYLLFPTVITGALEAPPPLSARLAGVRQWLIPVALLVLGHLLASARWPTASLSKLLKRYGIWLSVVALAGLVVTPLTFWAEVNHQNISALGGDIGDGVGRVEGLQSYFLGTAIPRAVAPLGSPLALAFSLVVPLCILWALGIARSQPWRFGLMGLALIATQTRSVVLGLAIVWLAASTRLRALSLSRLLAVGGVGVLLAFPLRHAIVNTVSGVDPSSKVHYDAINSGLQQLLNNWRGVGLGQGGQIGRSLGHGQAGGESLYLVAGNERGWLGLFLLLSLFITCIAGLSERLRQVSGEEQRAIVLGSRRALIAIAIASITTEHAVAFTSSWLLWLVVGYALGLRGSDRISSERANEMVVGRAA